MKCKTAINRVTTYYGKINELLYPISNRLAEVLDDSSAHIGFQASDGMVVVYRGGQDNASIAMLPDFDELLKLDKDLLLEKLDEAGI